MVYIDQRNEFDCIDDLSQKCIIVPVECQISDSRVHSSYLCGILWTKRNLKRCPMGKGAVRRCESDRADWLRAHRRGAGLVRRGADVL